MTMIERVARAMAGQLGPEYDELPRDKAHKRALSRHAHLAVDYTQDDLCDAAKAALEAMREPNNAMTVVGWQYAEQRDAILGNGEIACLYQAMINKALEESKL